MPNINVPYQPVPQAQPTPATPFVGDVATPQAFGVNIGRAEEQLGQTMERASSALESNVLQMQGYKTEAEVNSGTTDYIMQGGDLTNKFRQLPGSQAQEQLEQHINDLKSTRERIRAGMSSPKAQRDFDNATMHRFALDVVNSSQYAAQQMRSFTKQTITDNSDAIVQETAKNVRDGVPGALEHGTRRLIENERKLSGMDGEAPETMRKRERVALTGMLNTITSSTSQVNPQKAQEIFNAAKKAGAVDETKVEQIQNTIDQHAIQYYATMDGAEIANSRIQTDPIGFDKNPEGVLTQMDADAEKKGQERFPNDPLRAQQLTDELKRHNVTSANLAKKEQTERSTDLRNHVLGITNAALPNGRKPVNIQEMLTLDPKAQDFVEESIRRDPTMALRLQHAFLANSKQDNILRPEQIDQAKAMWAGMKNEEKQRVDPNALFNQGKINLATKDMMLADLNKMKSLATNTNDADMVLKHYKAMLNDQGIRESMTDTDANSKYAHLRGALQLRIADEQQRLGRPVKAWTPDEERRIMNQMIVDVESGEKRFWGTAIMEPAYERIYKTQVAPEMPAFVRKVAPNAQWSTSEQRWQTVINGELHNIKVPKEQE